MKKKITILDMAKMKKEGKPLTWITAYDLPFAQAAEQAGIDMILVGDSGGMVQLGYRTTNPVTMDEMITLSKAARSGAPNTFIIGDMPQGSYEISCEEAIRNALRFIKEAGCDAVKLEGGERMFSRVKAIVDAGILVIGHLGLTPQSASSFGGYRVQGKSRASFEALYRDAESLCKAGVFAVLIEAVPSLVAERLAKNLPVPIYGIGAGELVDGQLVIMHDLMGFYQTFRPWFAKCYIPQVAEKFNNYIRSIQNIREVGIQERKDGLLVLAQMAIEEYIIEVQQKRFPNNECNYPITDEQLADVKLSNLWSIP
jgi:3-methyl-2-oxobutanoate hydroxymethyltransferase